MNGTDNKRGLQESARRKDYFKLKWWSFTQKVHLDMFIEEFIEFK